MVGSGSGGHIASRSELPKEFGSGADERDGAGDEAAEQNEIGRGEAVEETLDGLGGKHVREPLGVSLRGRPIDLDSV